MGCKGSKTKEQPSEEQVSASKSGDRSKVSPHDDSHAIVPTATKPVTRDMDPGARRAEEAPIARTPKNTVTSTRHKRFKNGEPGMKGEMIECFKGGMLYRIVASEDVMDTWGFFNETENWEMHIECRFGPDSELEALGRTEMFRLEDGWYFASTVVYPGETQLFVAGDPNGYNIGFNAKPLSDEYRAKVNSVSADKVRREMQNVTYVSQGAQDEERILASCVSTNTPYVDLFFPPQDSSLSRPFDKREIRTMAWRRPEDYLPPEATANIALFSGGIDPNDIDQGQLGDCWFLCALAALAEFPTKVQDVFQHPQGDGQAQIEASVGAYRVTINKDGWWQVLIVDTYVPTVGSLPCFAKNVQDPSELWVSLLEKAYAKVHGSYASLVGGDALLALSDLTGYPTTRFDDEWQQALNDPVYSDQLFNNFVRYDKEGYLINLNTPGSDTSSYMGGAGETTNTASFEDKYKKAGLGMGHAYTVLKVKYFPTHNLRLLQIRNPWGGETEWTGAWGDDDPNWTRYADVATECAFRKEVDGTFWMEWESVKEYFDGGGVCFMKIGWKDYRVAGGFEGGFPSVALEIVVKRPVCAFVILSQPDKRGRPQDDPDSELAALLLSVCRSTSRPGVLEVHRNASSDADNPTKKFTFSYSRDMAMAYTFEPEHGPYLVVPRIYDAGASKPYVLGLISNVEAGDDFQVRFKTLPRDTRLFQNYPRFEYDSANSVNAHSHYQFNPERGTPVTRQGSQLTMHTAL